MLDLNYQLRQPRNREMDQERQTARDSAAQLSGQLAEMSDKAQFSELTTILENQKAQALSIQRDYQAYKEEHKISGDLGALQTAVAAMQAKLEERQDE